MKRAILTIAFGVLIFSLLCAGPLWAAPSLSVTKPPVIGPGLLTGPTNDPPALFGQWFVDGLGHETFRTHEFYDNVGAGGWGAAAITGYVNGVTFVGGPGTAIQTFSIFATVWNDALAGPGWMSGANRHGEALSSSEEHYVGPLFNVKLTASFALTDTSNVPGVWALPYIDRTPHIVAVNEDQAAWYCWNPDDQDPGHKPPGNYYVPTWDFGDIPIGQSATRQMDFVIPPPGLPPGDARYSAIMNSYNNTNDILLNRTTSLKISTWLDEISLDTGIPYPEYEPFRGSDVSVFHDTLDFGDVPDPTYPTLLANNGARHVIVQNFYMGALVDAEADGQPHIMAMGDDINGIPDDEDGVNWYTMLIGGVPQRIRVIANSPAGSAYLNGWIDLNGDGDWSDPGEQVLVDQGATNGINYYTFIPGPIMATGVWTYARFRLSSVMGLSYSGLAPDGEVEDYAMFLSPVKWLQRPDLDPTGVDVDNHNVELADDFRCTQTGPITDIHLWTSFLNDELPVGGLKALTFVLSLYADVPADPENPYSHPGELLWSKTFSSYTYDAGLVREGLTEWWHDPVNNTWAYPADTQVYQYDFFIPIEEAFIQATGTIYWLGVNHYETEPGTSSMGWKSSLDHWNDDACWLDAGSGAPTWKELRYGDEHPMTPDSMDLAFAVTGTDEKMDFGDAPDPSYPTLLASGGARHIINPAVFMGTLIDDETDGQPDATATGDDTNNLADEDGVSFPSPLLVGQAAQVDVTCSVAGWLWAWIDYDNDGGWAEAADPVFAVGQAVTAGVNNLGFVVPGTAASGATFARFRFTTQAASLSYTGLVNDGEVEDYRVWLTDVGEEPTAELGDAPDSSNSWGLPMTAYPFGGPPGTLANFPSVFVAGSPPFGPKHAAPMIAAYLGPFVSLENEADVGPDTDGPNNLIPVADIPDLDSVIAGGDDGVLFPISLPHCRATSFLVSVNVPGAPPPMMFLNVWFDWNRDGDWDDTLNCPDGNTAPEWAVQNFLVPLAPGLNPVPTTPFTCWHPTLHAGDPLWMRVTLAEIPWPGPVGFNGAGGDGPAGGYAFGETEDYYVTAYTLDENWDFGDAPDPSFPTLLASTGAQHAILPGFILGTNADSEADGQPDATATGDDLNNLADEDGVTVFASLTIHTQGCVDVFLTSGPAGGLLDAWVDFDGDGTWSGAEQVFSSLALAPGANTNLCFNVPGSAQLGSTFARFRLSSAGGLPPDGPAQDGEVEDYQLTVYQEGPTVDIVITNLVRATNGLAVRWTAENAVVYQPQFTTNQLIATDLVWQVLGGIITGPANEQTDTNAVQTQKAYRVIAPYAPPP